ncbi:MAG: mechanosensitive ion channel family protein [Gammaproteobacteria bacterium]
MDELLKQVTPYLSYFGQNKYLQAMAVFFFALIMAKIVNLFVTRILTRLTSKTKTDIDNVLIEALHRPLFATMVLIGLGSASLLLDLPDKAISALVSLLKSLIILSWAGFLLTVSRELLSEISKKPDRLRFISIQTLPLFHNLAIIAISGAAVYLVFSAWHIDMTAWLASAGIVGIAIGFAAKDTLANLFSGVFILADTPYKIGDYVVLDGGERGEITHIGIRSTRLLTRDDVEVTVPNSIMGNSKIINESGGPHTKFRIRVKVGVAYGSDIGHVEQVLMQIADENPDVCKYPEPRVRFRAFGDSSLDFELLCWVNNPVLRGKVLHLLNSAVYKGFRQENIEIPFNKQDIYIKELPAKLLGK